MRYRLTPWLLPLSVIITLASVIFLYTFLPLKLGTYFYLTTWGEAVIDTQFSIDIPSTWVDDYVDLTYIMRTPNTHDTTRTEALLLVTTCERQETFDASEVYCPVTNEHAQALLFEMGSRILTLNIRSGTQLYTVYGAAIDDSYYNLYRKTLIHSMHSLKPLHQ